VAAKRGYCSLCARLQRLHPASPPDLAAELPSARAASIAGEIGLVTAILYAAAVVLYMGLGNLIGWYLTRGGGFNSGKRRNVIAISMLIDNCIFSCAVC